VRGCPFWELVEQPQAFELVGVQHVRLVQYEDDFSASFVLFGGQGILGWGMSEARWKPGHAPELRRRSRVQAPHPDRGVCQ